MSYQDRLVVPTRRSRTPRRLHTFAFNTTAATFVVPESAAFAQFDIAHWPLASSATMAP